MNFDTIFLLDSDDESQYFFLLPNRSAVPPTIKGSFFSFVRTVIQKDDGFTGTHVGADAKIFLDFLFLLFKVDGLRYAFYIHDF